MLCKRNFSIYLLMVGVIAISTATITTTTVRDIKNMGTYTTILQEGKPVVIKFYMKGCGPCEHMKKIVAEVAKKHPEVSMAEISNDTISVNKLFKQYGIKTYPTFVLLDASGKTVDTHEGIYSESELDAAVTKLSESAKKSH